MLAKIRLWNFITSFKDMTKTTWFWEDGNELKKSYFYISLRELKFLPFMIFAKNVELRCYWIDDKVRFTPSYIWVLFTNETIDQYEWYWNNHYFCTFLKIFSHSKVIISMFTRAESILKSINTVRIFAFNYCNQTHFFLELCNWNFQEKKPFENWNMISNYNFIFNVISF